MDRRVGSRARLLLVLTGGLMLAAAAGDARSRDLLPTIDLAAESDTGFSQSDDITSDRTPTLTGTAPPGEAVRVFCDGEIVGRTTADDRGRWRKTVRIENSCDFHVDAAGEASARLYVTLLGQPSPVDVTLLRASDTPPVRDDGVTTERRLQLRGYSGSRGVMRIYANGRKIGEFSTPDRYSSRWTFVVEEASFGWNAIAATFENAAGRVSRPARPLMVYVAHETERAVAADAARDGGVTLQGAGRQQVGLAAAVVGDLNGDGLAEVAVSTRRDGVYVLYGRRRDNGRRIALDDTPEGAGFWLDGPRGANLRLAAAGDVDGDGFGDLVVGAPENRDVGYPGDQTVYVLFGRATFPPVVDGDALDGSDGFRVRVDGEQSWFGDAVASAGDFNGDGFDDILIGEWWSRRTPRNPSGVVYLLYGRPDGFSPIETVSPEVDFDGLRIFGRERFGSSVAGIGDFNGDGTDDIAVGAFFAGRSDGTAYVLYGKMGRSAGVVEMSDLEDSEVSMIHGPHGREEYFGRMVSGAGDLDGDGIDDLLVSYGDRIGWNRFQAAIVYGRKGGLPRLQRIDDMIGKGASLLWYTIDTPGSLEETPLRVAGIGDFNGDGVDDAMIGAPYAATDRGEESGAGFVVYGVRGERPSEVLLEDLPAWRGLRLEAAKGQRIGYAISGGGDADGDGLTDIVIGEPGPGFTGGRNRGAVYLIDGRSSEEPPRP